MAQAGKVPTMLQEDANDPATIEKVRMAIPDWTLSLVLLDPQKLNLAFDTIERLTRGEQPMDLLINLPVNGLKRSLDHPHHLDIVLGSGWTEKCDINNWPPTVRAHFREKLAALGYDKSVGKQVFSERNKSPLYDFIMASRSELAERFFEEVTRETAHHQMAMPLG
jgi:three-Cys-motif partner protein